MQHKTERKKMLAPSNKTKKCSKRSMAELSCLKDTVLTKDIQTNLKNKDCSDYIVKWFRLYF